MTIGENWQQIQSLEEDIKKIDETIRNIYGSLDDHVTITKDIHERLRFIEKEVFKK